MAVLCTRVYGQWRLDLQRLFTDLCVVLMCGCYVFVRSVDWSSRLTDQISPFLIVILPYSFVKKIVLRLIDYYVHIIFIIIITYTISYII